MSMSRRIFAALMPQAALAAPVMANEFAKNPTTIASTDYPPTPSVLGNIARAGRDLVAPPGYKKYLEIQEAAAAIHYKLYMRKRYNNNLNDLDFDIVSLKSVSHQHKISMQVQRDEERRKNERSFTESLIDELGLRNFMRKRSELNDVHPAAEAGML